MPAIELDATDRKILDALQADSRMTMQALAEQVNLSASPCHRRVRLLEERGVISRYIALVDQKSRWAARQRVRLDQARAAAGGGRSTASPRRSRGWPEVLECYLMTGPRDYLLRVVVADLEAYETLPQAEADPARRHRLDRVELRAPTGQVFDRLADVSE